MMKKFICLLMIFLLCSCSNKDDFFTLAIDNYHFTIGYDDVNYLKLTFNLDIKEELNTNEKIKDIDVSFLDKLFCRVDIENNTNKQINSNNAIISKLVVYLNDIGNRTYKIDDTQLDSSVKSNCNKLNGKLIEKNGYACIIEKANNDSLSVVELHGDILNIDQDILDHIVIYQVKE